VSSFVSSFGFRLSIFFFFFFFFFLFFLPSEI